MTEMPGDAQADVTRLKKLVTKKRFDELEALWLEAIVRDDADVQGLLSVVEAISRRDDSGVADSLFWYMLSELTDRRGAEQGLALVRQAAGFLEGSSTLREEVAAVYEQTCGGSDDVRAMAEMTVLHGGIPFATAVKRFDRLLRLRPGTCVIDTQVGKLGQVVALDGETKTLEVAFDDRSRTYDRLALDKLEPLADDDLRSRMVKDRDGLERMAAEAPPDLIKTVLGTYGPRLEFRELKEHLKPIVSGSAWTKWWAEAKVQCKRDPMIEMSDDAQPWLFLRSKPVAYEDELKAAFDAATSAEQKLVTVLGYLAECGNRTIHPEIMQHFGRELAERVETWRTGEPAMAAGALGVVAQLRKHVPDVPELKPNALETLLSGISDLSTFLRPVGSDDLARCILEYVRETLPTAWHDVWSAVMPSASQAMCEWIVQGLLEQGHGHDVLQAIDLVLTRPERYPYALAWLWKAVAGGKFAEVTGSLKGIDVAVGLLIAAGSLGRDATFDDNQQKAILSQLRSALSLKNYECLHAALKETDDHGASRAHHAAVRNFILGEHARLRILDLITRTHAKLFLKTVPPWEDDAIYTTATGLQRHQQEFAHLVNIKMAANAKAIGEAAAFGDLSENAEFTAALEERNLLTEKAARMEADLKAAKLISAEMVNVDHVTVGSAVVARDVATGESETLSFLGPWDSAPQEKIYSYKSPLAMAFMGGKIGDTVELSVDSGIRTWEILEIHPADLGPA
ncbi:MAG: GreA/GreB family elongation factor [Planctomycetes bacterium]|nr:GreA/GreB family elongation factor [Planctomycetota bacterium]